MVCRKCHEAELYRMKRKGFLRGRILSLLGFYPWRCNGCGYQGLYRARGEAHRTASPSQG